MYVAAAWREAGCDQLTMGETEILSLPLFLFVCLLTFGLICSLYNRTLTSEYFQEVLHDKFEPKSS